MNTADFIVTGDAIRAKLTVVQALESRKFRLNWTSEWDAVAERGNKVANALAGALAQYFKVDVLVRSAPDGNGVIRIVKSSKGYMGGAIGARRTTKNFDSLVIELEASFRAAGVLVQMQSS